MGVEGGDAAEAVGRLGAAIAAKGAASVQDPRCTALAAVLAGDIDFLHGIPGYATAHARAAAAGAEALDPVWPRSSPARPGSAAQALDMCRDLAALLGDPLAAAARSVASLPPGEGVLRIRAEARQVLLMDKRLSDAGIDPSHPDATETGRAALALESLYRDHRIPTRAAAIDALAAARRLSETFLPLAGATRRLADLAGIPDASATQVSMLARCLAEAPSPWPAALEPEGAPSEARADLAAAVARHGETRTEAAALDASYGAAWRSEEPGKLEAAARLLAMPGDPRRGNAVAFAESLGCRGPAAAEALSRMARTRVGQRRPWPPACMQALAGAIPVGMADDPEAALAHLDRVAAWSSSVRRGETLGRFHAALTAADPGERDDLAASAPALVRALAELDPQHRRAPAADLAGTFASDVASLERHVSDLGAYGEDALEAARRPANHLRERRSALTRLGAEPSFAALEIPSAETVPLAMGWVERARTILPEGVDPTGKRTASLLDAARLGAEAFAELKRLEDIAADRVGETDPGRLVAAAHVAIAELRLREARAAVAAGDGWGLVAWLEEEGIEPELWAEALAARSAERIDPAPEPTDASPVEDPATGDPPDEASSAGSFAAAAPAASWIEPAGLAWRRLEVRPA